MLLKEYRNIYNNWNNFLNEAGKVLTSTEIENMGAKHQSATSISSRKKAITDPDRIKSDLVKNAGPSTFITFVNPWDENTPSLTVNPNVSYDTPHGIYGYPLTRENAQSLISHGQPTQAQFATDYKYFHIFKLSDMHTKTSLKDPGGESISGGDSHIVIQKDGKNNYSRSKLISDATEIFSKFLFICAHKFKPEEIRKTFGNADAKNKNFNKLKSANDIRRKYLEMIEAFGWALTQEEHKDLSLEELIKRYLNYEKLIGHTSIYSNDKVNLNPEYFGLIVAYIHEYTKRNNKKGFDTAIREFMTVKGSVIIKDIFNVIKTSLKDLKDMDAIVPENITAFHMLYYFTQSLSHITEIIDFNNENSSGYYFSLYLNLAGIKNITDKGSSSVHPNEPEQSLNFSFESGSDNSIVHVGTYLNIFKDLYNPQAAMEILDFLKLY
tara:strand:- start:3964 stop:5277 length:1314 start_codon:yes stop_codon:yes gene_type:complete